MQRTRYRLSAEAPPLAVETDREPLRFVVHEHFARSHHYDLRLEWNGVLKSWAVPKGLPLQRGLRRLAIKVEDHPLAYARFEGSIPTGRYGAGEVRIWDQGVYRPRSWTDRSIIFTLHGQRVEGTYALVNYKGAGSSAWLLFRTGSASFYQKRAHFIGMMRHAISLNGSFFNTQRMIQQYALKAYLS